MTEIQIRIVVELDKERTFRGEHKWRWEVQEFSSLLDRVGPRWNIPWGSNTQQFWGVVKNQTKALDRAFAAARYLHELRTAEESFEELRDRTRIIQLYVNDMVGEYTVPVEAE